MNHVSQKQTLYDQDFDLWLTETIEHLKNRRFDQVDIGNVIEELDALSKSQKRELLNRLDTLLSHLLKRLYVPRLEDYGGWEITIREQRKQLSQLLEVSFSLKANYDEYFARAWQSSLAEVREDYPDIQFPDHWQFSAELDAILAVKFWGYTT